MPSIEDFAAAGLYDPAIHAGTGRLELLEWLDGLGFTIEEMRYAHARPAIGLVALPVDRRLLGRELMSRAEALAASGLAPADFDEMVQALGLVRVDAAPEGDVGFTAAEAAMLAGLHAFASTYSREEAKATLRVIGSSLARIAEAAVSLFLQDVEAPHVRSGGSELVHAQQAYEAVALLDADLDSYFGPILRRHAMQAIERTRAAEVGPDERFDYRFAVGFVDLVGFTTVSATMSAPELGELLREFEGRSHDAVVAAGARVVKLIGDEVMFVATDPSAACRAADALLSGFGDDDRVLPRGGLAYGNVLLRGGDYYGPVVNLASRLVDQAVPEELLVTDELADAATGCTFAPAGRRMLKGFDEPVAVCSLVRS